MVEVMAFAVWVVVRPIVVLVSIIKNLPLMGKTPCDDLEFAFWHTVQEVDIEDDEYYTPLHIAVVKVCPEFTKHLIEKGTSMEAIGGRGRNPITVLGYRSGKITDAKRVEETIKILIESGC